MNYELLQELKDAGFPKSDFRCVRDIEPISWVGIPTLSELTNACGEDFGSLTQSYGKTTFQWRAVNASNQHAYLGFTPEEAVARFWLALNKK